MINFLFCTVLPPESSKVDQTHKFDDFSSLTQLFPMTPYSALIGIKVVKNYVMSNFKLHTVLTPRVFEVCKIQPFRRKISFFGQL